MKKYLILLIPLLLFFACAHAPNPSQVDTHQVTRLNNMLNSLHPNYHEAKDLAQKAIMQSRKLAQEYHLVTPPLLQNFLVNIGLKEKGLCWQFAYDMLTFVKKQQYQSHQSGPIGALSLGIRPGTDEKLSG
mgnify:CR=1 FL=1